jgi:hypothetical protein
MMTTFPLSGVSSSFLQPPKIPAAITALTRKYTLILIMIGFSFRVYLCKGITFFNEIRCVNVSSIYIACFTLRFLYLYCILTGNSNTPVMKRIIDKAVILILMATTFSGCLMDPWNETIYGEGPVTRESRDIEGFTGIRVSSGIDVIIKQGSGETVLVETDENLHEVIETEWRNDMLHVFSEVNIKRAKSKKVFVTIRELNRIKITSAGDVIGEGKFTCKELEIDISSAGDLNLEVDASKIDISLSSSGDAKLTGRTGILVANLSSAGDLNAFGLESAVCRVTASSAGNARVWVTEEIDASASSAGDIYYRGDPQTRNVRSSSAGGIHQR